MKQIVNVSSAFQAPVLLRPTSSPFVPSYATCSRGRGVSIARSARVAVSSRSVVRMNLAGGERTESGSDELRQDQQHTANETRFENENASTSFSASSRSNNSSSILPPPLLVKSQHESTQLSSGTGSYQVAIARALTPMRRPREDLAKQFSEEQLPSQRRTDLLAPKTTGFWSIVPYVAASAVVLAAGWLAKKRFVARQDRLVDEFGDVMVRYGTTTENTREIASEYKRKLGPWMMRGAMFASYLQYLIADKAIVPSTIQDVNIIKRLLGLSEDRAVLTMNELAANLTDAPSLLGKLLFIANRIINDPKTLSKVDIVQHFPYSPETVGDLQRNMLDRCFKEYIDDEISANQITSPPMNAAAVLKIDVDHAQVLFDAVVEQRRKKKEAEEARLAALEAEQEAVKEDEVHLDSPARPAEPTKPNVHAYQCTVCGYTLFPAAGREFKFYGDDFVCPACGAPKDKFTDLNAEEE